MTSMMMIITTVAQIGKPLSDDVGSTVVEMDGRDWKDGVTRSMFPVDNKYDLIALTWVWLNIIACVSFP